MTQPFAQILCSWQPSILDAATIEREFGALLGRLGITWDADSTVCPKSPATNFVAVRSADSTAWHRDGHGGHYPYALVFWSNRALPDVISNDGRLLRCRPGDVILVRNRLAWHKTPATEYLDRWLAQAWVSHEGQIALRAIEFA